MPNPRPSNLSPTKILILRVLEKDGEQTVQQICEAMGMKRATVYAALVLLRDLKLVRRSIRDGANKLNYWRIR